jgi:hypothetical protein
MEGKRGGQRQGGDGAGGGEATKREGGGTHFICLRVR